MPETALQQITDLEFLDILDILDGESALADPLPGHMIDHGPESEPVTGITLKLPVEPLIDLLPGEGVFIGVHRLRVLQDFSKIGPVGPGHLPEREARRGQNRFHSFSRNCRASRRDLSSIRRQEPGLPASCASIFGRVTRL